MLGPSEKATYSRGYRRLDQGDALLLYTDGMVEAHGAGGEEFGVGRLIKDFLDLRELPSDEIARALIKRVGEWAGGGEPEDDRTVVVLKRHTEPFRARIVPPERRDQAVVEAERRVAPSRATSRTSLGSFAR